MGELTREMEKQRIVWPRILDEPMHTPQDVGLCRLAQRVSLVFCEGHHVLWRVAEILDEIV